MRVRAGVRVTVRVRVGVRARLCSARLTGKRQLKVTTIAGGSCQRSSRCNQKRER